MNKKLISYGALMGLVIVLDRITKSWALTLVQEKVINNVLSFGLTFNRGINWGIFNSTDSTLFVVINVIIAVVIMGMMIYTFYSWQHHQSITGHICILAGALSNYFDRIYYGGVIDFIIFSLEEWSWPAFNIADAAIVLGVVLVAWDTYRSEQYHGS
jgi:signal peptidase II